MKKLISILVSSALMFGSIAPVLADEADTSAELLALENCRTIRSSATLFFNKEVNTEILDFDLIDSDEPETEIETEISSEDNKKIVVSFSENLEANKSYILSAPMAVDAEGKSVLFNISVDISTGDILYSDDFESYASSDELAEKYIYKNNAGALYEISDPGYKDSFEIETQEDGNHRLKIKKRDNYRRLMPKVADESIFKDYILEYTVANGQKTEHGVVAYQGAMAYDAGFVTVTWSASNGLKVVSGDESLTDSIRIAGNNSTKIAYDMSGNRNGGKLSVYMDGACRVADLSTKYSDDYGLFGFFLISDSELYIDDICAYRLSSSFTSGEQVRIQTLAPEISCESFEICNNVVCNTGANDSDERINVFYDWYTGKYENQYPMSEDDWELSEENSESNTYTVENDKKYIRCTVKQSIFGITVNTYNSPALFKPMPPFINIKDGKPNAGLTMENGKLTASYEYVDANSDKEKGTSVEWFISSDISSEKKWELKKTAVINADDENKDFEYDVSGMTDAFVKCVITVRSEYEQEAESQGESEGHESEAGEAGENAENSVQPGVSINGNSAEARAEISVDPSEYTGEPVALYYTLPFRPIASDVKIVGKASVGNILKASYNYHDENGDKENTSKTAIEWYRDGGSGEMLGSGVTYAVNPSDAGEKIYCRVIPHSENEPSVGEAAVSSSVLVSRNQSGNSNTSTGGGSGGGGSLYNDIGSLTGNPYADQSTFVPSVKEEYSFPDLKGHWAKNDIEMLYKQGLVKGHDNGMFSPDENITRAEWIALLMRAAKIDTENVKWQNCFADVDGDSWYAPAVQAAYDNKLISGSGNGIFAPDESITREAMIKMLTDVYEYSKGKSLDGEAQLNFSDSNKISGWAELYIKKAVGIKLISGDTENCLNPGSLSTRAEAATVLARMLKAD